MLNHQVLRKYKKSRTGWGKGKLQVSILKEEIMNLLVQGKNLEEIYLAFLNEEKITIGKSTFKRHARTLQQQSLHSSKVINTHPIFKSKPIVTNTLPPLNNKTFIHSPEVTEEFLDSIFGEDA